MNDLVRSGDTDFAAPTDARPAEDHAVDGSVDIDIDPIVEDGARLEAGQLGRREFFDELDVAVRAAVDVRLKPTQGSDYTRPPRYTTAPRPKSAQRQVTLDAAYATNPERFARQGPQAPKLPTAAWMNQPSQETLIQTT